MTINSAQYAAQEYYEAPPPLTPTYEGKVQFLGPDTVKYISPPRVEVVRSRMRSVAPAPPPPPQSTAGYSMTSPPPPYHNPYQAPPPPMMAPQPQYPQYQQYSMAPPPAPVVPQMIHPQMVQCIPQTTMMTTAPIMAAPVMAAPQMIAPVQLSPPQIVPQQASPAITLCINQSPQTNLSPTGSGGALICPKCRKGIITRKQDRFRKRLLICLALCCCPLTCGIPLACICCNYVDTCGACRKTYGHRGRKNHKTKVNAVKI